MQWAMVPQQHQALMDEITRLREANAKLEVERAMTGSERASRAAISSSHTPWQRTEETLIGKRRGKWVLS